MTQHEKYALLERLDRLEQTIKNTRELLRLNYIILPCSQVRWTADFESGYFRIGDFIIRDTSKAIPVECNCSERVNT